MRHRPFIVVMSAFADLLVIGAIVVASGMAPDVLPVPHRLLAAPIERVVQLPDIPLPPSRRTAAAQAPPAPSAPEPAPVDPPASLGEPAPGAAHANEHRLDAGIGDAAARVERGDGLVTGAGLPAVAAPVAPAVNGPVRLHSGIEAPRKLHDVLPIYPAAARAAHVQGVVILEVTIDARGGVESARVLRSLPGLDQAAVDAVTQWTFAPARLNGQAIPVVMTVTVNFQLQ